MARNFSVSRDWLVWLWSETPDPNPWQAAGLRQRCKTEVFFTWVLSLACADAWDDLRREPHFAANTSSSSGATVNAIRRSQPESNQDAHHTGECDGHGNLGERRRKRTGEIILHKSR